MRRTLLSSGGGAGYRAARGGPGGLPGLFLVLVITTALETEVAAQPPPDRLLLHLAADQGVVVDPLGGVSSWENAARDHDAQQHHLSRQPELTTDPGNGLPALLFDGHNDRLFLPPSVDFEIDTFTWFIVFRPRTLPAGDRPGVNDVYSLLSARYGEGAGPNVSSRLWGTFINGSELLSSFSRGDDGQFVGSSAPADAGELVVVAAMWDSLDGVTQFLSGIENPRAEGADALPLEHEGLDIGALFTPTLGVTRFFDGWVQEILVYDTCLDPETRELVEGWLAEKYDVNGDFQLDHDGDGLTGLDEQELGTDPFDPDSDDDGLTDGEEATTCLDPLSPDSDGDSLTDLQESLGETDPCDADTDGDGLDDGVDPDPLDPRSGLDRIAAELRRLAADMAGESVDLFSGRKEKYRIRKRNALASRLLKTAREVDRGNFGKTLRRLLYLRARLDACPRPRDWMLEGPVRDELRAEIEGLVRDVVENRREFCERQKKNKKSKKKKRNRCR